MHLAVRCDREAVAALRAAARAPIRVPQLATSARGFSINGPSNDVPPLPQESLLLGAIPEMSSGRLVFTSPGLAQAAGSAARAWPNAAVSCTYLDLYRMNLAREYWRELPDNLRIECAADLPNEAVDVVALPLPSGGEAELARDFIQAGHERLVTGGRLYAATENRDDIWLGEQLHRLFRKLERRQLTGGILYVATKVDPLKKPKDYSCEFAFRDRGRLIRAFSRPGVFSHRRIDTGARRLIDAMTIPAHGRVLDIGCGSGVVALAAACRAEGVQVHAVDSNARAVQCTERGAALNGLGNVSTELNAEGDYRHAGEFDLALANPPYYAGFRIARHFLNAGRHALRSGGTMLIVTKRPEWYREHMPEMYEGVCVTEEKGYFVVEGICR